ncbi:MAG: MBL fold metallo-hydrolase, partial [Planctomycetota bacterium]
SRTRALLASRGVPLWWIDDIVLTHLDLDHFHNGWKRARDCRATLRLHRRHVGRAERQDKLLHRNEPFDDADGFALGGSTRVTSELLAHDEHGVAALRFNISSPGTESVASLGFATDLGRVTQGLVRHLGGVDVLAIESNYCPEMQRASDRPAFLKKRIMGGAGHLSNAEAADAVGRIGPRDHAVFLHMSRECNQPAKIAELHAASDYAWTIATQHEPTRWVWLKPSPSAASARPSGVVEAQPGLFEGAQAP